MKLKGDVVCLPILFSSSMNMSAAVALACPFTSSVKMILYRPGSNSWVDSMNKKLVPRAQWQSVVNLTIAEATQPALTSSATFGRYI